MRWFVVLTLWLSQLALAADEPRVDAGRFDFATDPPARVDLIVHVRDASALRRLVEQRLVAIWLREVVGQGHVDDVWERLASACSQDSAALFDLVLGEEVTLFAESSPQPPGQRAWLLRTSVDEKAVRRVLSRLHMRRLLPRGNREIAELTDHDLLLSLDERELLIAPRSAPRLFHVLTAARPEKTPAGHWTAEAAKAGRTLGAGQIALLSRHAPPLGGWSAAVAQLTGDHVEIRHAARFASPPFSRSVTRTTWNASALESVGRQALMAIMEPTDIGGGAVEAFSQAYVGRPLLSRELRQNSGAWRLYMVGEVEGRLAEPPVDLLLTTASVAFEVKNPILAEHQLDQSVRAVCTQLNRRYEKDVLLPPATEPFLPGAPRRVEISATEEIFGGLTPLARRTSINWVTVDHDDGSFCVVASHPESMAVAAQAIRLGGERDSMLGTWQNCGVANGPRLGLHLRAYGERADLLVGDDADAAGEFRRIVSAISDLAMGIERCQWRLKRPTHDSMRLEVDLLLTPPESSP